MFAQRRHLFYLPIVESCFSQSALFKKDIAEQTFATLQPLVYQLVARCVKSLEKKTVWH